MNDAIKIIVISLITIFSSISFAEEDNCIRGVTKYNICDDAKQLANEMAAMLPINMSQHMSFDSVAPIKNKLPGHIRLRYTKALLQEQYANARMAILMVKDELVKSASQVWNSDHTQACNDM